MLPGVVPGGTLTFMMYWRDWGASPPGPFLSGMAEIVTSSLFGLSTTVNWVSAWPRTVRRTGLLPPIGPEMLLIRRDSGEALIGPTIRPVIGMTNSGFDGWSVLTSTSAVNVPRFRPGLTVS